MLGLCFSQKTHLKHKNKRTKSKQSKTTKTTIKPNQTKIQNPKNKTKAQNTKPKQNKIKPNQRELEEQIEDSKSKKAPLREVINEKEKEKLEAMKHFDDKENKLTTQLYQIRREIDKFKGLSNKIKSNNDLKTQMNLTKKEEERLKTENIKLSKDKKEWDEQLKAIDKWLDNVQTNINDLQANLAYRNACKTLKLKQIELQDLKQQLHTLIGMYCMYVCMRANYHFFIENHFHFKNIK